MRFVIVGPGALGALFGAALSEAGHEVTLLGRPSARLNVLRDKGLQLQARDGTIHLPSLHITDDATVVGDADVVIVLVKSHETAAAMERIKPFLPSKTPLLTLQNGLGNAETIRHVLGQQARVLPGATSQGAMSLAPDLVRHAGEGPTLIGYEMETDAPVARDLARAFSEVGLPSASVPDIDRWLWHKVAVNAAINGLTALAGIQNGEIVTDPGLLEAAETVAEEVAAVARARGIELGNVRRAVIDTAAATAANRSSMLQDLEAGRQTEVDTIHGAIVAAASASGLSVPATSVLAALISARSRSHRAKDSIDD